MNVMIRKMAPLAVAALVAAGASGVASAQVAGSSEVGVSVEELRTVAVGWSAKKDILGKTVFNESNQKVGTIDDIIVAPDSAVSYAIVGAGGFVGLDRHNVAIPVRHFRFQGGKFVLPGATQAAIKALPAFQYAK